MEIHRKQYANEVYAEIKRLEVSIKRNKEAKKNIVNIGLTSDQLFKKQNDLQKGIEEKEEQLKLLSNRKDDYLRGYLDDEIKNELIKNQVKKPSVKKTEKIINKNNFVKPNIVKTNPYKERYNRNTEKDMRYYYRQFCKADDTLPEHMRYNLENMPNNKGYIWRGCLFFGHLRREQNQPYIFFEKLRGGDMNIHEFNKTYHNITLKKKRY